MANLNRISPHQVLISAPLFLEAPMKAAGMELPWPARMFPELSPY